ncbi:MAG: hypothetical protein HOP29_17875 [Phycisphaerales bacterium]|nr:hypothetical protein [Phycisphaerales bacterium]
MPFKEWPNWARVVVYVSGAITSALIGAYAKQFVDRAVIRVAVDQISIAIPTPEQLIADGISRQLSGASSDMGFSPSPELNRLAKASTWTPEFDEKGSLDDYLPWVHTIRDRSEELLREIPAFRRRMQDWPTIDLRLIKET